MWALLILAALAAMIPAAACVQAKPPVDTGADPVTATSGTTTPTPGTSSPSPTPTPTPTTNLTYTQNLRAVFNSDCVVCHGSSGAAAGYSMATYASVMRDVIPGNANSRLVVWTQPNGTMYRYFSGNRASKADMVKQWVVNNNAAQ